MKKLLALVLALAISATLFACKLPTEVSETPTPRPLPTDFPEESSAPALIADGHIYLYGYHSMNEALFDEVYKNWYEFYYAGMRDFFTDLSFSSAEYLNMWMTMADDDQYLCEAFAADGELTKDDPMYYYVEFLKHVKRELPETVFHGTGIDRSDMRITRSYISYLETRDMYDSDQYYLAKEGITQCEAFYLDINDSSDDDKDFYINALAANFQREYDALFGGTDIMGLYRNYTIYINTFSYGFSVSIPTMATKLNKAYKDKITPVDLSELSKPDNPMGVDTIEINGKYYDATYYGKYDFLKSGDGIRMNIDFIEFWRLEDAYEDFKDLPVNKNGVAFYIDYPMSIVENQVYMIKFYYRTANMDGTEKISTEYFRSDPGGTFGGMPATLYFSP